MTLPPIHIVSPVWGEAYVRCFLDICLASLLAPANIEAMRNMQVLLHVFSTAPDLKVIEASPVWTRAKQLLDCRVEIIEHPSLTRQNPHIVMSNCHRKAIAFAGARSAALVFNNPDIVFADACMGSLKRLLSEGKRAVQVIGLRLLKEDVVPILKSNHTDEGGAIVVSPRQLMSIAMERLHPITQMHLFDAQEVDLMPQDLLWRVGSEGLVARCFHLHPILVHPRVKDASFSTTVDDDFLRSACPDPGDEYVVTDSDEFCLCELSDRHRVLDGMPRVNVLNSIIDWAWTTAHPHHLEHLCRRIYLHSKGAESSEWNLVGARTDEVVEKIIRGLLSRQASEGNPTRA